MLTMNRVILPMALLLVAVGVAFQFVSLFTRRWLEIKTANSAQTFYAGLFTLCQKNFDCLNYDDVRLYEVHDRLKALQATNIISLIFYILTLIVMTHLVHQNSAARLAKWVAFVCGVGGIIFALACTFIMVHTKEEDQKLITIMTGTPGVEQEFLNNTLDTCYGYSFHLCWTSVLPVCIAIVLAFYAMMQSERNIPTRQEMMRHSQRQHNFPGQRLPPPTAPRPMPPIQEMRHPGPLVGDYKPMAYGGGYPARY